MKKDEYIRRYGKAAWEKMGRQSNEWNAAHPERKLIADREKNRKGGKYYEQYLAYNHTGLRRERKIIRSTHQYNWRQYKRIIAPDSQLHHSWCPNSAEYTGLALVEADAHMHGFIAVIEILDGEITLLTEEEVRNRNKTF